MSPLVSIIVPCYNQAQYLNETLRSVCNQTYQNWECIIINDGSPDNTAEIASKWCKKDPRYKYLFKSNGGLSSARNAGIRISAGIFLLPLDSDDLIHPGYLEKSISCFIQNPVLSLVYCKAKKFGFENCNWNLPDYDYKNLLLFNLIFCSAIYRKSDWIAVGGYDEHLKHGFEDWAFWLKLLNNSSVVYRIPELLFFYRTKSSSMLTNMTEFHQNEAKWVIFNDNIKKYKHYFKAPNIVYHENELLKEHNSFLEKKIERILSSRSYKLGNILLKPLSYMLNIYNNAN